MPTRKLSPVVAKIKLKIKREDYHHPKYDEGRSLEWKDEDGISHQYRIVARVEPGPTENFGTIFCDFMPTKRPN